MKDLFQPEVVAGLRARLATLAPASTRQWGTMTPAQALAHCSVAFAMTMGEAMPPRMLIGSLIGWAIKPLVLRSDAPFHRNAPTAPSLVVSDQRDFEQERTRLFGNIERFAAGGPGCCTSHPHPFFGRLTPAQWSQLLYKHLDHHLRQFGV